MSKNNIKSKMEEYNDPSYPLKQLDKILIDNGFIIEYYKDKKNDDDGSGVVALKLFYSWK